MGKFKEPQRKQNLLLANVNFDSVAPIGSPVRVIDEMIQSLNTSNIEKEYALESIKGRKPFHPKTIIKVCLFALHSCRFSLRKMENDTANNLAYRWLTGNEIIDHSTIGKFLIRFKDYLKELFTQTVIVAVENGLVDFEVLSIDSVKIRANASHKQDRNMSGLEKEEIKVNDKIKELLDNVENEHYENEELKVLNQRKEKILSVKKILQERINKKCKYKFEPNKEKIIQKEKINITDPDSHKMQQANGEINPSYSTTTSVDAKADIITNYQVNEEDNDNKALLPAIDGSEKKCGKNHETVNADAGFSSIENLEKLNDKNQDALIPDKRYDIEKRGKQKKASFDRSNFKYNSQEDYYRCPEGNLLNQKATFKLNGREQIRYENPTACINCSSLKECTSGKKRTITRDSNEQIKEEMRESLNKPGSQEIYKLRAHSSESPFGNIKHNLKYRIFNRRSLSRVNIEMGLLCILHNILKSSDILQV